MSTRTEIILCVGFVLFFAILIWLQIRIARKLEQANRRYCKCDPSLFTIGEVKVKVTDSPKKKRSGIICPVCGKIRKKDGTYIRVTPT